MDSNAIPYRFTSSDIAIIIELYIPKRAQYQALLFDVLAGWYQWERNRDLAAMRKHFESHEDQILALLEHYRSLHGSYRDVVREFPLGVAVGHSVYEVDGFFADSDRSAIAEWAHWQLNRQQSHGSSSEKISTEEPKSDISNSAKKSFAAEERTLVVRFVFRFPERQLVNEVSSKLGLVGTRGDQQAPLREAIRGLLRTPSGHQLDAYIRSLRESPSYMLSIANVAGGPERVEAVMAQVTQLVSVANKWVLTIALWLFGYLVLKFTSGMNQLVAEKKLEKNEDEIWITSFWDVALNRILPNTDARRDDLAHG